MSALPIIEPPQQQTPRRHARHRKRQVQAPTPPVVTTNSEPKTKVNPVYIHRRRGVEAIAKLVTYSSLSIFGLVTLVNSIGYNLKQSSKLQTLEAELQDTKQRTDKIDRDFARTFDATVSKTVMAENTYRVAADRLQVVFVSPQATQPTNLELRSKN
jgi:electron transfer flavoprotein alpha/beta subunit